MKVTETGIPGLVVIEPNVFRDSRGYFFESYNKQRFEENGLFYDWVQDNQSQSVYGVLRGLHYQLNPYSQAKLVRVIRGAVLDVAVDIRPESPTFGKWVGVELSQKNKRQIWIPAGFAHGFVVLSDAATFFYKVDKFYEPGNEVGIMYNDKDLNIDWKLADSEIILSEKDKTLAKAIDFILLVINITAFDSEIYSRKRAFKPLKFCKFEYLFS